jgi:hypothetical protein
MVVVKLAKPAVVPKTVVMEPMGRRRREMRAARVPAPHHVSALRVGGGMRRRQDEGNRGKACGKAKGLHGQLLE